MMRSDLITVDNLAWICHENLMYLFRSGAEMPQLKARKVRVKPKVKFGIIILSLRLKMDFESLVAHYVTDGSFGDICHL